MHLTLSFPIIETLHESVGLFANKAPKLCLFLHSFCIRGTLERPPKGLMVVNDGKGNGE